MRVQRGELQRLWRNEMALDVEPHRRIPFRVWMKRRRHRKARRLMQRESRRANR